MDLVIDVITVQIAPDEKGVGITEYKGAVLHRFEIPFTVEKNEWIEWLRRWGYKITLLQLPETIVEKIRKIMKEKGYVKEWEVISTAVNTFQEASPI